MQLPCQWQSTVYLQVSTMQSSSTEVILDYKTYFKGADAALSVE